MHEHTVRTTVDSDTGLTMFAFPQTLAIQLGVQEFVWLTLDDIRQGVTVGRPLERVEIDS